MRVLYRALLPLAIGMVLACGSDGKRTRCSQATVVQDCGAGMDCSAPVAGEQGVCVPHGFGNCLQDCGNTGICNANGDCKPRYALEVNVSSDATVLGAGPQQVVVTVTRGTKDVPYATSLQLSAADTSLGGAPVVAHTDTSDTYTWTYTPPSGVEEDVSFVATASGSGTSEGTTITATSPALTLAVDTKAPTIEVIPDNSGSFAVGSDMTFQVTVADAHPPTGALKAAVGTTTVDLSYQGPNAGASVYRGTLTRAAMAAAGLGCSVSVTVTAQDTAGNSSTSSPAQMAFTCAGSTVCSPEAMYVCQPKYLVAITSPAAGTLISASQAVTATVTLGTATVTVPTVQLAMNGTLTGSAVGSPSQNGLVYTYGLTYSPPSSTEADNWQLTAVAAPTTDKVSSLAVSVSVDTKPPVVNVALNQGTTTPYLRTDQIGFTVTVTDMHYTSSPSLQAMLKSGDGTGIATTNLTYGGLVSGSRTYSGSFDLSQYGFVAYRQDGYTITSSTADAAGNPGSGTSTSFSVTRLRWPSVVSSSSDASSPAVMKDHNLVVGVADQSPGSATRVVALNRTNGNTLWTTALSSVVVAPPVVGNAGVWVLNGSQLCLLDSSTGVIITGTKAGTTTTVNYCCAVPNGIASGTNISITPVLSSAGGVDTVTIGGSDGRLFRLTSGGTVPADGNCPVFNSNTGPAVTVSPVLDSSGNLYWANASNIYSNLSGGGGWGTAVPAGGSGIAGALALDSSLDSSSVWAAFASSATQGGLVKVSSSGAASTITQNWPNSRSPAGPWPVLAGLNDVLIGRTTAADGSTLGLGRVGGGYTGWPSLLPAIVGNAVGSLVITSNGVQSYLVPTDKGSVYLFDQSGALLWNATISSVGLHEANITTEVAGKFSTAYFGSTDGHVYAVIMDGVLDTTAPWPKVRHDPQNTGNAGTLIVP